MMIEIMESEPVFSFWDLRGLCIKNRWFTVGSNEQYEKLFWMNDNGYTVEELALVIWICSSNDSIEVIREKLEEAAKK